MKPNKVLGIQGFFSLPDNFDGTYPDALRELANYHEKEGVSNPNREVEEGSVDLTWKDLWKMFLKLISQDKGKSNMLISISQLSEKENQWTKLIDFKKEI